MEILWIYRRAVRLFLQTLRHAVYIFCARARVYDSVYVWRERERERERERDRQRQNAYAVHLRINGMNVIYAGMVMSSGVHSCSTTDCHIHPRIHEHTHAQTHAHAHTQNRSRRPQM